MEEISGVNVNHGKTLQHEDHLPSSPTVHFFVHSLRPQGESRLPSSNICIEKLDELLINNRERIRKSYSYAHVVRRYQSKYQFEAIQGRVLSLSAALLGQQHNFSAIESIFAELINRFDQYQLGTPDADALCAKVYALAYRCVALCEIAEKAQFSCLSDTTPSKAKASKPAPHIRLFGGRSKTLILPSGFGDTVNHIVLLRPLGEGTFNKVFLSYDIKGGRLVVCRMLQRIWLEDKKVLKRWRSEARHHLQLTQKGVRGLIAAYDAFATDAQALDGKGSVARTRGLLLEHCEGDLLNISHNRRLAVEEQREILVQLLYCLGTFHQLKVTHGDLKPSNIFYNSIGCRIKVGDLGSMKPSGKRLAPNGTYLYYPIDGLYLGRKNDEAIDCHAIGLIAYQLRYGEDFMGRFEQGIRSLTYLLKAYECNFDAVFLAGHKHPLQKVVNQEIQLFKGNDLDILDKEKIDIFFNKMVKKIIAPSWIEAIEPLRDLVKESQDFYDRAIYHLLDPDPSTRWTCATAYKCLSQLTQAETK